MSRGEKPSPVMARNACPREGGERAMTGDEELIRRMDMRRLDGPAKPDHDS